MAGDWKNMKDKMGQSTGGPSPADWEAMRAKIDAQPALSPASGAKPWLAWFLIGGIGLSIAIGAWYFLSFGPEAAIPTQQEVAADPVLQNEPSNEMNDLPLVASDAISEEEGNKANSTTGLESQEGQDHTQGTEFNNLNAELAATLSTAGDLGTDGVERNEALVAGNSQQETKTEELVGSPIRRQANEALKSAMNDRKAAETRFDSPLMESKAEEFRDQGPGENGDEPNSRESGIDDSIGDLDAPSLDSSSTHNVKGESPLDSGPDKPASEFDALNNLERPSLPDQINPPFINPKTGFRLSAANVGLNVQSDLVAHGPLIYGLEFDLQWHRNRQFFSAGLAYYQVQEPYQVNSLESLQRIDSTFKEQIEDRTVIEVSRVWVIDSFQAGRYVYDTTITIVSDTNIVLQVDTNQIETSIVKQLERKYSYAELPLLYGYEFGANRLRFRMAGGLALQQAVSYSDNEAGTQSRFGLTALMQPEMLWQLNPTWSLSGRMQLRYPLQNDFVLYQNRALRYSFQLGVSYRW